MPRFGGLREELLRLRVDDSIDDNFVSERASERARPLKDHHHNPEQDACTTEWATGGRR